MRPPKATFRRHGRPWSTSDGQSFTGLYLDSGLHWLTGTADLAPGMVVFLADSQGIRYIVTAVTDHVVYQTAQITPADYLATISRTTEGAVDSFGRPADDTLNVVYEGVPLVLESSSSRSAAPQDRPAGDTCYRFRTAASYSIKVSDQVDTGTGDRLLVQAVRLRGPGLAEIKAVSA